MPWQPCVRCKQGPLACDAHGFCGHCQRTLTAEAYAGLAQMGLYLKRQAEFADYLETHPRPEETT